jgi:hypothetical protein
MEWPINFYSKNIIILSEPRSGSHWFQSCLFQHYSLGEFFNVKNIDHFTLGEARAHPSPFVSKVYSDQEINQKIHLRMSLIPSVKKLFSIKIHTYQLNSLVVDWINGQDASLVFLKRRDRRSGFLSLLIANHIGKYSGKLEPSIISITRAEYDECTRVYFSHYSSIERIEHGFHPFFYEDLLTMPETTWFKKKGSWMVKQNSSDVVKILNHNEVLSWLEADGFTR